MNHTEAIAILSAHVVETLPDSQTRKKQLLFALRALMREDHPAHATVESILAAIKLIEDLQPLLSEEFRPQSHRDGL